MLVTDRPNMTSTVYRGRKALNQTNQTFVSKCFNMGLEIARGKRGLSSVLLSKEEP